MNIEQIREQIRVFRDKDCGQGASSEEIENAERALGVSFPASYRNFLREFGWARISHQELYGLGAEVPAYLELVRNTLAERSGMEPSLPASLIPIMNDGAGNHYCLDTSQKRDAECPVVFWDHELGAHQEPAIVSESFDGWLMDLISRLQSASNDLHFPKKP